MEIFYIPIFRLLRCTKLGDSYDARTNFVSRCVTLLVGGYTACVNIQQYMSVFHALSWHIGVTSQNTFVFDKSVLYFLLNGG